MLTLTRIMMTPLVYYVGFAQNKFLFLTLFVFGGITDALDGFLARRWKKESSLGNLFDTVADIIFYPTALMIYFFVPELEKHILILVVVFVLAALSHIFCYFKGGLSLPHPLPSKISAILVYFFVIYTLMFGFSVIALYTVSLFCIMTAMYKIYFCEVSK